MYAQFDNGHEALTRFMTHLNNIHDTIKFTYETSEETINFLDVQVSKNGEGGLNTDLYTKPTDAHAYLQYESCHPPHIKKSLPYSQAIRLCRICNKQDERLT